MRTLLDALLPAACALTRHTAEGSAGSAGSAGEAAAAAAAAAARVRFRESEAEVENTPLGVFRVPEHIVVLVTYIISATLPAPRRCAGGRELRLSPSGRSRF